MEQRLTISGMVMNVSHRLTISGTMAGVKESDQGHVLTLTQEDQKGEPYNVDIECPPSITLSNYQQGQQITVTLAELQATAVEELS